MLKYGSKDKKYSVHLMKDYLMCLNAEHYMSIFVCHLKLFDIVGLDMK